MIVLLTGENGFAIDQALKRRVASFAGETELFDAADLTAGQLADITTGQTFFSTQRCIIIKQPSECKELWTDIARWLEKLESTDTVILVEAHIDKRTAAYKWLQKNADVEEHVAWTERDRAKALQWMSETAKQLGMTLSRAQAERILTRTGYDQWALHHALDKLSLVETLSDEIIDTVIETSPTENVFALLETALSARREDLARMLETLRQSEDAYRVFGLLSSQVLQLSLLIYTTKPASSVARDIGAGSPYMLQKLERQARILSQADIKAIVHAFAKADMRLKSSDVEPWSVVESLLHSITKQ